MPRGHACSEGSRGGGGERERNVGTVSVLRAAPLPGQLPSWAEAAHKRHAGSPARVTASPSRGGGVVSRHGVVRGEERRHDLRFLRREGRHKRAGHGGAALELWEALHTRKRGPKVCHAVRALPRNRTPRNRSPSPVQTRAAPWVCSPGRLANTRFAYVRSFELPDVLLPHTWVVVRIDGKGFTKCVAAVCLPLSLQSRCSRRAAV